MKIIKTECIVLKKKEMKEADLLVTLFSKEYGKITAMAYGIRKSKKRNIVSLNPLNIVEITLFQRNNYYVIKDAEVLKNFKNIVTDIEKLEISLYILDSINKIYYMTDENNDFFDKLVEILSFIDKLSYIKKGYKYYVVLSFLRRMMIEQGIYDTEEISLIMEKEQKENNFNRLYQRYGVKENDLEREVDEFNNIDERDKQKERVDRESGEKDARSFNERI